jgi:hypothetical protein
MLNRLGRGITVAVTLAALAAMPAAAPADTATRPGSTSASPGMRPGPAFVIQRLKKAVSQLNLGDDQKTKVDAFFDSANQQGMDLSQSLADVQPPERYQKLAAFAHQLRQQLSQILTDEQMETVDQTLERMPGRRAATRPAPDEAGGKPGTQSDALPPADLQSSGPDAGSSVPAVRIIELNGHAFSPSQYKGHVLVLEFGSMSCPVFRQHVQEMETLKAAEGPRAFFMVVYTREAFPAGEKDVQRNKDEGISIAQTKTLDDRKAQALEAQRELRITIPMAVDSMDDAVSNAYGTFPNGAIVIGKDGAIAAHLQWTNPDSLRVAIDQAYAAPAGENH